MTGIQNINEQQESAEYFEEAKRRLDDAIATLQLLLGHVRNTKDAVLRDFKAIIEAVLTQVRCIFRVLTEYEEKVCETGSTSFACPTKWRVK